MFGKKNFVQRIFKALFTKKTNYGIRTEATPVGRSKKYLHQKLHIVICNNFCLKKIFVQCIFKARFAQKPNCALRTEVTPVGRFCSYAIPTEIFIMPNLVELAQLFFELWWPQADTQTDIQTHRHTDRQTDRQHAKNNFFGLSGPQNVNIHQNLEVDFWGKCNTFSILRIA